MSSQSLTTAPAPRTRISLLGMPIDVVTEREAVARIVRGAGGVTVTPNLDHLHRFHASADVRRFYGRATLVTADGMPLVWASRLVGTPLPERVAGSTMIWALAEAAAREGAAIYLVGGNPGSAQAAAEVLARRFDGLKVAGTRCPPIGFERDGAQVEAIAEDIARSPAKIVLVGLPLDKQIALIEPLYQRFPDTWFLGVGASFSFVCGDISRAPRWMQRLGIEWVHRLAHEPRRLARRYLLEGVPLGLRLLGSAALTRLRVRVG